MTRINPIGSNANCRGVVGDAFFSVRGWIPVVSCICED